MRSAIRSVFISACLCLLMAGAYAQQDMRRLIGENMSLAAGQYKILAAKVPADSMPRYYDPAKNRYVFSNTKWWCSGFFPGSLWLIYEQTRDPEVRRLAEDKLRIQEKEKHYKGNHDLGFMMYCSFGTAYRITGDQAYRPTIDTAAMSLITRYRPSISSIQSWDSSKNFKCPVIIDNMMNLELLCWVSENGTDSTFRNIAVTHANSTMERQYRPDFSSWHVLDYDLATASLARRTNWQGYSDASAWSRGQAWGLYGFTVMYRFTKDPRYLTHANGIAKFLLGHPRMPKDLIPYWDFDAPEIPNAKRDASAAAIMASALLELSRYNDAKDSAYYVQSAERMIRTLSSDQYRSRPGESGGFLLKHNVGFMAQNSEVDVSLTYADYYFLEAMGRYRKWVLR